ncbi:MAG: hypothetical protein BLITH_0187 [Brockia lithotrophica]|uniref:Uncharacterized protein n=1 Tax=Brockia lithotrophica TaxID=933949 RepID=A0A2T5GA97_9BACL|nr:hypothetical protein [Brockia lithotrophica]PTQ53107.1 MAG: hypothetical protein BLITH_0187 [Brockia lithotrophica]
MLPLSTAVTLVAVPVFVLGIFFGSALWFGRTLGFSWSAVGYGAFAYFFFALMLGQIFTRQIFLGSLGILTAFGGGGNVAEITLLAGTLAFYGVFGRAGTLALARDRLEGSPSEALSFGMGYGGMSLLQLTFVATLWNFGRAWEIRSRLSGELSPEALWGLFPSEILRAFLESPWILAYRYGLFPLLWYIWDVALSALLYLAVVRKKYALVGAAFFVDVVARVLTRSPDVLPFAWPLAPKGGDAGWFLLLAFVLAWLAREFRRGESG